MEAPWSCNQHHEDSIDRIVLSIFSAQSPQSLHSIMDPDTPVPSPDPQPSLIRWILGFLLVGACWGLTTPFMRRAAINYTPPNRPALTDPNNSWLKRKVLGVFYAVTGVLSRPAYAIPFLLNVTGSVWFFVLIGKAGTYKEKRKFVCRGLTCRQN